MKARHLALMALVGAAGLCSSGARADVQHTIAKGHTIQAIANRYRVTPKSIIEANRLKDVRHLKIGDVLTIPKVDPPKKSDDKGKGKDDKTKGKDDKAKTKDAKGKVKDAKEAKSNTYAAKAKTPGVIAFAA